MALLPLDPNRPLRFPQAQDAYIPRRTYVYGYTRDPGNDLLPQDHLYRLVARGKDLTLLSAEGTGKSSLLNKLILELESDEPGALPLGPLDLRLCRQIEHIEDVLANVHAQIIQGLQPHHPSLQVAPVHGQLNAVFSSHVGELFEQVVRQTGRNRVVLLLDDLQDLSPRVASRFSAHLRHLHDAYDKVSLVLTDHRPYEELMNLDWSPLTGLLERYSLQDFVFDDLAVFVRRVGRQGSRFEPEAVDAIYRHSKGYPYLVTLLFQELVATGSNPVTPLLVDETVATLLMSGNIAPFETARKAIIRAATGPTADRTPWELLQRLLARESLTFETEGARFLALHGVVVPDSAGRLAWRNPMIEAYLSQRAGEFRIDLPGRPQPVPPLRASAPSANEAQLRGRGWIHVSLILDLRRFVKEAHKLRFDQLRGSDAYVAALKRLKEQMPGPEQATFQADDEITLRNTATDLGIFRHTLADQCFLPMYRLHDEQDIPLSDLWVEQLGAARAYYERVVRRSWQEWERKSLQLTRDGLVHVRLEKQMVMRPMEDYLRAVLELATELSSAEVSRFLRARLPDEEYSTAIPVLNRVQGGEDRSVQWEIALGMVEHFIESCFEQTAPCGEKVYHLPGLELEFDKTGHPLPDAPVYPLRDRYVVYALDKLCAGEDGSHAVLGAEEIVPPPDQSERTIYGRQVGGLLEGVLIERKERGGFPNFKSAEVHAIARDDLSSWDGELCLLTGDNAFIYFRTGTVCEERRDNGGGPGDYETRLGQQSESLCAPLVDNEQRSVGSSEPDGARIERISWCPRCGRREERQIDLLRFADRIVEYEHYWLCTIRGIQYIMDLRLLAQLVTQETTRYTVSLAERLAKNDVKSKEISDLRNRIVGMTRLLSHLREAAGVRALASADYAWNKFDRLIGISGLRQSIEYATSNLREANALLEHFENLGVQQRANRTSVLFSLVAVVLSVLTIPSFLIDWRQFAGDDYAPLFTRWLITLVYLLGPVLIVISLGLAIWFGLRGRRS